MFHRKIKGHIHFAILWGSLLAALLLGGLGIMRLQVDTDVINSLPESEGVLRDALDIFANHPMLEQIAIDLQTASDNPDSLVAGGKFVEEQLRKSGLFTQVGTGAFGQTIPALALHAARHLPLLFSAEELREQVVPRLTQQAINKRMSDLFNGLTSMAGIGRSQFIGLDPLGLKDLVLARLAPLAPTLSGRMYQGHLLSTDSHHLLVTAHPTGAGTDSTTARHLAALLKNITASLQQKFPDITLHAVGAFRAALDNETIIRHDVNMALLLAMVGIGLLLMLSFSRPFIGLLSLVPALAGNAVALFVYSLFNESISIMVLGFGSAVISITVDHGIAYLLFLDRPDKIRRGDEAVTEVRAVGLLAVLTSVGAFLTLSVSGFPLFTQLGQFSALGVLFSFCYVHAILPRVLPVYPVGLQRRRPLQFFVDKLAGTGLSGVFMAAGLVLMTMLWGGFPSFDVSLESMNTVSKKTMAADKVFKDTWGDMGSRVLLMTEGNSLGQVLSNDQKLTAAINHDLHSGALQAAFISSMFFPDQATAQDHYQAWKQFWSPEMVAQLQNRLDAAAAALGFTPDAFAEFFQMTGGPMPAVPPINEKFFDLLGISAGQQHDFVRFVTLVPGKKYKKAAFADTYRQFGKVYDPGYFSAQLGKMLFATFGRIFSFVAVGITLMLLLFFLSLPLTVITLLPVIFAYVCTLGTLSLLGRSLDIPSLMLSVVILGMGIDYSIFFVRAHQRFRDPAHPLAGIVRMTVFMAGFSTLIGFGVLAMARHSLLQSIGITCLLGIGYSLLGAFLILPPLLTWYFERPGPCRAMDVAAQALCRFYNIETYPRMFARFKLRYDPMFSDLPELLPDASKVHHIVDIGCGYGVPAAWCMAYYPDATITALDPNSERSRVAALAIGNRGRAFSGWVTDLPADEPAADLILLLDMLHYLDDQELAELFARCAAAATTDTVLIIRYTVDPGKKHSLLWYLEQLRLRLHRATGYFRGPDVIEGLLKQAGFVVVLNRVSADNQELFWLQARKM